MNSKLVMLLTLGAALCGHATAQNSSSSTSGATAPAIAAPTAADTAATSSPASPPIPILQGEAPAPAATTAPAKSESETSQPGEPADASAKGPNAKGKEKGKDELEFPHDGKTDDVSAIGNRNVGCSKGLGNWYSLESQVRLGKSFSMQVEQSARIITDPVVSEYINRIAQNLVRNSDAKVPFTVKVLDDDSVNAFALPGGYFYVQSGLILAADNEAELAGVMAHEIAHVAACHAARQQTRGNLAQLASIPLIMMGGGLGYGLYEAAGVGVPMTFMKFQRNFEAQADYLGLQYMYAAGYDPQAFPQFFEKVQALEKKKPGFVAKAFETHPPTPGRMERTQHEIATILPPKPQYVVDTSEFQDIKTRLAALENRRRVDDGKDNKGPTLRRATTSDDTTTSSASNKSGDDRPTLKRREDQ
jgi:predicted Zn-dependent protease